jgi:hypothetical protein
MPIVSPHASLLRPELHGSRAILPGSPMPQHYDDTLMPRSAGASVVPAAAAEHTLSLGLASPRDSFSSPPLVQKKFKIYYCLEMAYLAQQIVKLDDRFVLADIHWDHFPDGQWRLDVRRRQ